MIPKIKRSVKKFLLNESGMVSKQSLLRMGVGLAMLTGSSIKASGAELTSESWSNSAVDGDSCSCTRTVSGSTWTDDWDRFKEFISVDDKSKECECDYDSSGCNEWWTAGHINFHFDGNLGDHYQSTQNVSGLTANRCSKDSDDWVDKWCYHESCDYGSLEYNNNIKIYTPWGIHDNSISLSDETGISIKAEHDNAIHELDLTIATKTRYHDSTASW